MVIVIILWRQVLKSIWGILLKGKDIKTIQRNYEKIIKEYNKQIINNLIKLIEIVNNSKTNTEIFEL